MFADRLKSLRKEKQLSQEQLSLELHVSRQAISKWETGVLPDVENLINIAHFLNVRWTIWFTSMQLQLV